MFDQTPSGIDLNTCLSLCQSNNAEACNYGWGGNNADRYCESEHSKPGESLYEYIYPGVNPAPYNGTRFSGWSYTWPQTSPCSPVSETGEGNTAGGTTDETSPAGGSAFKSPTLPAIPTQGLPSFGQLVQLIFTWSLNVLGIVVFVMIFYAGFKWFTAAGNTARVNEARGQITNAITGAIILLAAYIILYTINPDLVGGKFTLPGLGGGSSTTTPPEEGGPPPSGEEPASLLLDVQVERAKYGALMTPGETGQLLITVAWNNRAVGWGLSGKDFGTFCPSPAGPIACDILHHQPTNILYDVFTDSGNTNGPIWNNAGPPPGTNRPWVAPVQP